MMRSMYTAASGMGAEQSNIDVIANNLANVNTTGYKKARMDFQDLLYQTDRPAGQTLSNGSVVPVGFQVGLGTRAADTQRIMNQGVFQQTGNPLDVGVQGAGFFQVTKPDGTVAYTRDGSLKQDANGQLVTSDGYPLQPAITIPSNATSVIVGTDGTVSVVTPGNTTPQNVGQLQLATFPNPVGLQAEGRDLYMVTAASGQPITGNPASQGFGTLSQGFLEMSNVQVVDEMVNMITAQRAYEINAKVIQGSDRMLGIVAELKQ